MIASAAPLHELLSSFLRDGIPLGPGMSPAVVLCTAFALGVVFGAVPAGAAEALALAAGALEPMAMRVPVLLVLTAGHIVGKAAWYWAGTLGHRVRDPRVQVWVRRAQAVAASHRGFGLGVMATSSFASVPPFQLTIVAAGVARAPVGVVLGVAFLGRLLRFGLIAAFPAALRGVLTP